MKTCQLIDCWRKQKCHLEEDGITDLCPAVTEIVTEAVQKTEKQWADKFPVHEVVPLDRVLQSTKTITDTFTLEVGLKHMENRDVARKKKFLKDRAFEKNWDVRIVDPGPQPQAWVPEHENNYEVNIVNGFTSIEDRSVYRTTKNINKVVQELHKSGEIITKKQKSDRSNERESVRIENIQKDRFNKMLVMMQDM